VWDENVIESAAARPRPREHVDLDTLDDGRCKASTWRPSTPRPAKPTYENHFGPGGYNRCIGSEGHVNPLHKDEWGYVFAAQPVLKVIRHEEAVV
jgi:hypothetical protein